MNGCDVIVIGGGLVGLATAYHILKTAPDTDLILLEKEPEVAQHQSGRNSGVLHSGIYYAPDSLKNYHCQIGKPLMEAFCAAESLPFESCSKVIVAVDGEELAYLHTLVEQGQTNGVECELINANQLRELEPHAAGIAAIHVPYSGVVDYQRVAQRLAMHVEQMGGRLLTNQRVIGLQETGQGVIVKSEVERGDRETWFAPVAVNAAGLYADRLAGMMGMNAPIKTVPFRGEYYTLRPGRTHLVRNLIYPVPNPELPFLGIHLTRTLDGSVDCGPNAVFTSSREGYNKINFNLRDLADYATSKRLRKLTRKQLHTAVWETRRSFSKELFTVTLQRLVPDVREDDLLPAPAGIRAQAVDVDGNFVKDFVIEETERMVHCLSVPSPGATGCLSVGRSVGGAILGKL